MNVPTGQWIKTAAGVALCPDPVASALRDPFRSRLWDWRAARMERRLSAEGLGAFELARSVRASRGALRQQDQGTTRRPQRR